MNTEKPSPRRLNRFWLGCFSLLLGLPLLYYGYCWGLWGRHSLLLQYFFQCGCSIASNKARYPEEVDVIVPACRYTSSRLSPSGYLLYVREEAFWRTSAYVLDLRVDEKFPITPPEREPYFLTDNLMYVSISFRNEQYILNRTTGDQYTIKSFRALRPDAYVKSDANREMLAEALHRANYVFLIKDIDTAVALTTNFPVNLEQNFTTDRFDIPGLGPDRLEQFLKDNNVIYETVIEDFPGEIVSPDESLVARSDGIYLIETNQKIAEVKFVSVRGWANDGRAAIYVQPIFGPCLIETNFGVFDDFVCLFEVSQPILKLKVPEEYLSPTELP